MRQRVLIATTNADKLREIRALLEGVPFEVLGLADLAHVPAEPQEEGETFEENARLKARYYAAASGMLTVAEDSGLVIDALGGAPGVRSARFIRPDATYPERFRDIYRQLSSAAGRPRTTRFVCAAAAARDHQVLFETVGRIEGEIADRPRGTAGFGYDPIFYYPPLSGTLAEVDEQAKLRVAHRGEAFRAVREWLMKVESSK